jgi:hypothetical protein
MAMSVTSVTFLCQRLSRLWGGEGGVVQIFSLINFNTPFRSCFTKLRLRNILDVNLSIERLYEINGIQTVARRTLPRYEYQHEQVSIRATVLDPKSTFENELLSTSIKLNLIINLRRRSSRAGNSCATLKRLWRNIGRIVI